MAIRTEQTLRRMWDGSASLARQAAEYMADANECLTSAEAHERAAAAESASAASAHRAARAKQAIAQGLENEANDLFDLVNRERTDAGLSRLAAGDPYPAEPATGEQPMADDPTVTRTDGEVAQP